MTTKIGDGSEPSARHHGVAPQAAWSDIDALMVSYGSTLAEVHEALAATRPGKAFSDPVRSWVHEHLHLYQSTTTPFGLYIWRLRSLQTVITRDLLIMLPRELGRPVKLPLLRYIRSLPQRAQEMARDGIATWYAAELFLTQELGSMTAWTGLLKGEDTAGLTPDVVFRTLQAAIARIYDAGQRTSATPVRESVRIVPGALLDEPIVEASDWRALQRALTMFRLLVDDEATLPTVLESAAFAAELWGRDTDEVDRVVGRRDLGSGRFPYLEPLGRTAAATGTSDVRRMVLTHLAICDLALCAPILPQHRSLRRNGLAWRELLPELRQFAILGVLSQVGPMRDLDDYGRFAEETCDRLGWVSPKQIAESANSLRPPVPDLRDNLYETAMQYRRRASWLFVWPEVSFAGSPELQHFHEVFNFPIIEYADKVLYHKDKEWLAAVQNNYLFYMWHRSIMTGQPRQLKVPWRSYPEEIATLREQLRSLMSHSLGRDTPSPNLQ